MMQGKGMAECREWSESALSWVELDVEAAGARGSRVMHNA